MSEVLPVNLWGWNESPKTWLDAARVESMFMQCTDGDDKEPFNCDDAVYGDV